jgi:hypothetical protein
MRRVVLGAILIGCSDTTTSTIDAPGVLNVAGHVTGSATWQGDIAITAATTIDQGVTVSVMPGATIAVGQGLGITVLGTLDLEGSSGSMITIAGDVPWAGVTVGGGSGAYTTHYTQQSNGGVHVVSSGATATVMDSELSHGNGDLVTVEGGTLDVEYSSLGLAAGMTDTTYDDIRVDAAKMIVVIHTNVSTATIGVGLYAGSSDFTYDNWFSNQTDLDKTPGTGVSCDVSFGWFENGAPSGSGITAANMATSQVTDAGPRL